MGMACGYEQADLAAIIRGKETISTGVRVVNIYKDGVLKVTMI